MPQTAEKLAEKAKQTDSSSINAAKEALRAESEEERRKRELAARDQRIAEKKRQLLDAKVLQERKREAETLDGNDDDLERRRSLGVEDRERSPVSFAVSGNDGAKEDGKDHLVGEKRKSVGAGFDEESKTVSLQQEGIFGKKGVDDDGEDTHSDYLTSLSVGADGIEAGGIPLFGDWTGDFALKKGQQRIAFDAPTEWIFPPPKGLEMDIIPEVEFPLPVPGLYVGMRAAVDGQISLSNITLAFEHTQTDPEDSGIGQVVHKFAITGGGQFGASAGIGIDGYVMAGVPTVLNAKGGARAKAAASAQIGATAGGYLEITTNVPTRPDEKTRVLGKDGQVALELTGTGSLSAALSAFVSVQVVGIEGDLWEVTFVGLPLADVDLGARLSSDFTKSGTKVEPADTSKGYASFDWLLAKAFKTKRIESEVARATDAKGDIKALKELKKATMGADPAAAAEIKELMEKDPVAFENRWRAQVAALASSDVLQNGEVRQLTAERERTDALLATEATNLADLKKKQSDIAAKQEALGQGSMLARIKNTFARFGAWREKRTIDKAVADTEKKLEKHKGSIVRIDEDIQLSRAAFVENVKPKDLDLLIEQARQRKHEVRAANFKDFTAEEEAARAEHARRKTELEEQLDKLLVALDDMEQRAGHFETDEGKKERAEHRKKQEAARPAFEAAESRLAAADEKVADLDARMTSEREKEDTAAREADDQDTGFFGFFKKLGRAVTRAVGTSDAVSSLKKERKAAVADQKKAKKAYDSEAKPYLTLVQNDPFNNLHKQIVQTNAQITKVQQNLARNESKLQDGMWAAFRIMQGEWTAGEKEGKDFKVKGAEADIANRGAGGGDGDRAADVLQAGVSVDAVRKRDLLMAKYHEQAKEGGVLDRAGKKGEGRIDETNMIGRDIDDGWNTSALAELKRKAKSRKKA